MCVMQPRAVRVPLLDAYVRFNGFGATLVNISRSGALVRLSEPAEVGTNARLTLSQHSMTIEIDGKVVRAVEGGAAIVDCGDDRLVGITFVSPPPREVTALLRRLIAQT